MLKNSRKNIAIALSLIGLGGLAGIAVTSAGQSTIEPVAKVKPEVRTKVIKRTIRKTKKAKPRATATPVAGAGPSGSSNTYAAAPPTTYSAPAASPAPTSSGGGAATTSQSGSGYYDDDDDDYGYEDDDYEYEDDDDDYEDDDDD